MPSYFYGLGAKHLVYLIARIIPYGEEGPRYRCVCAIRPSTLCSAGPGRLLSLDRFLRAIKQKENAEVIREEIRSLDRRYGRHLHQPSIPAVPCPYLASLLATTWMTGLSGESPWFDYVSYYVGDIILSLDIDFKQRCVDGLTVIDVSDPEHPSYRSFQDGQPLPATDMSFCGFDPLKQYAQTGNTDFLFNAPIRDGAERIVANATPLQLSAIGEAWDCKIGTESGPVTKVPEGSCSTESALKVQSCLPLLTDLAVGSIVSKTLHNFNIPQDVMDWLPSHLVQTLQMALLRQSRFPRFGVPLLKTMFLDSDPLCLDLSGHDFVDDQIAEMLTGCGTVEILNLSRCPRISIITVRNILEALPKLRRLIIMGCPNISSPDMATFLSSHRSLFRNLQTCIHPAFVNPWPQSKDEEWTPAFSFVELTAEPHTDELSVIGFSVPFFQPADIVQGFVDFLTVIVHGPPPVYSGRQAAGLLYNTFSTAVREPGVGVDDKPVIATPRFCRELCDRKEGGWIFLSNHSAIDRELRTCEANWAFLRVLPAKDDGGSDGLAAGQGRPGYLTNFEVYNLQGFLRAVTEEGRYAVPQELVHQAEGLLRDLSPRTNVPEPGTNVPRFLCMTELQARECMRTVQDIVKAQPEIGALGTMGEDWYEKGLTSSQKSVPRSSVGSERTFLQSHSTD